MPEPETRTKDASAIPFDEAAYLTAFTKVAENVRAGLLKSGHDHYLRKGMAEGWLDQPRYRKALAEQELLTQLAGGNRTTIREGAEGAARPPVTSGIDAVLAGGSTYLAIGWADDRAAALDHVSLRQGDGWQAGSTAIARFRRRDAEAATGCPPGHLLGFHALIEADKPAPGGAGLIIDIDRGGTNTSHATRPSVVDTASFRESVFENLAASKYYGSPPVESFLQLEGGFGARLLACNQAISGAITRGAHVERHGPQDRVFAASIIVCLYGRIEYFFLQTALFSTAPGAAEYEFVYVCNSPELIEALQREARIVARLYGLSITLVLLPGNAGFGAANNVAVNYAASSRILMLNPDVLPRDRLWPQLHKALVDGLPKAQTMLFGAPLFYDDGSLMHGGMFVDTDTGLSVKSDRIVRQSLLRVEHHGKGAPPETPYYRQSRRVTAVTGAFICADRAWFEKLGGFSEEYVFGHYEDADLCLKAWQQGGEVWLHDLPMWHLEGKGSTRRPSHEGGSLVNRWHFTKTWLGAIENGFGGPAPRAFSP